MSVTPSYLATPMCAISPTNYSLCNAVTAHGTEVQHCAVTAATVISYNEGELF